MNEERSANSEGWSAWATAPPRRHLAAAFGLAGRPAEGQNLTRAR
jgi:hypothetical protein